MGLLDDLTPPAGRIRTCIIRTIAESLDKGDAEKFLAAIANPSWKGEPLASALQQRNIQISASSIRTHRQGRCACSRT